MTEHVSKYSDEVLGEILFKQNLRSKRMFVKILPGHLEVNLPHGFTEKNGLQFLFNEKDKILKKKKSLEQKKILLTENNPLQTLTFAVQVKKANRKSLFSSMKSGVLTIEYPETLDEKDEQVQQYFWNSINYFLRKEAKRVLPKRTRFLAEKFNFNFSDVKIQSSKTRWGSCNQKKAINLSFYLLLLPQYLIDYVILHELCHTKELNHSPRFWEWMDRVTDGQAKTLRKELKAYMTPR
ncbi:MAG: M48 family metallopeptidase [Bacteroidales bacterium]|nr:M48 family metallopeptidase [Bacteroidales bacterium]